MKSKENDQPLEKLTDYQSGKAHASFDASFDYGGKVKNTTVVFRKLGETLVSLIDTHSEEYPGQGFILAAVAWFSNAKILDALIRARKNGLTIMVVLQKEDFLRQDTTNQSKQSFKDFLRDKYTQLGTLCTTYNAVEASVLMSARGGMMDSEARGEFWWPNTTDDENECDAVRCVGNHNANNSPSFARMHNKFMVFGKSAFEENSGLDIEAVRVWTGSFNCSACADKSFENAVIIEDSVIAEMYMQEFACLFLLSESLDWSSTWMRPEVSYST